MKQRVKILFLAEVLLLSCMLCGCGKKLTPKKLMASVIKNIEAVQSFSNTVQLKISLEGVVSRTEVSMDMTMENTLEPKSAHAKGTASVEMRGQSLESVLEIYQVSEEDHYVTYSSIDGQWSREEDSGKGDADSPAEISVGRSIFQEMEHGMDDFRIAEKSVEVDGKKCWQMYGDVKGRDLMGLLGSQMVYAYGLVDIPDAQAVAEMDIPIIFEVYQDGVLPARLLIDMTDVMNSLYEESEGAEKVDLFVIKLGFSEYGQVEPVVVPDKVRQAAGGADHQ